MSTQRELRDMLSTFENALNLLGAKHHNRIYYERARAAVLEELLELQLKEFDYAHA